jgi:hypothetical protein
MTADQNVRAINNFLLEHCDGFFIVAFNPSDNEPLMAVCANDGKTETALNSMIQGVLQAGGVGAVSDQIKAKEKENPPSEN